MNIPGPFAGHLTGWPWTVETAPVVYLQHRSWPKISIITPSFNQGHYLEQTIRSVLLQNYPNLEYIIIDGGSTDESVDIIRKYAACITHWVSEQDNGQSDALNKGVKMATGEIVAWINSDDYYEKDAFIKIVTAYWQPGFSFFCGTCEMIDGQGKLLQKLHTKKITYSTLIKYWKPHFCPPQPSIFFKRDVLNELGGFNVELKYAMDYALWLKASKKHSFYISDENISYYRVHKDSKTGSSGGLRKFIPEWKLLIAKSLEQEPIFTRWRYYLGERMFLISAGIRRLFNRYQLKNSVRQWLTKNPGSV